MKVVLSNAHKCDMHLLWNLRGRIRVLIVLDCAPCIDLDPVGELIPAWFGIGDSLVKPGPKLARALVSILVVRLELPRDVPNRFDRIRRHIWVNFREVVDEEDRPDDLLTQRQGT